MEKDLPAVKFADGDAIAVDENGLMVVEVPQTPWYKQRNLRKLYAMMPIMFLGATTNGYDGSLLNGLQTMEPWRECKSSSKLRSSRLNSRA